MRVMATEGYDGATVSAVAAEAGLTPGLVHYHFKSKLDILLMMLDMLHARHRSSLDASVRAASAHGAAAQLAAFLDAHLAVGADTDPRVTASWVSLSGEALRHAPVREAYEAVLEELGQVLREIIDAGCAAGDFQTEDPASAVSAVLALIQGYFMVAATARGMIPRGSASTSARLMAEGLLKTRLP